METELYIQINLWFDNDFDVTNITRITGITPYVEKNRKDNRISPLTNRKVEGWWAIKSEKFFGDDMYLAYNDIINKVGLKLEVLKDLCEKNSGDVIIWLVATFGHDVTPYLEINREFINFTNELNASIRFISYIDDEYGNCETNTTIDQY